MLTFLVTVKKGKFKEIYSFDCFDKALIKILFCDEFDYIEIERIVEK